MSIDDAILRRLDPEELAVYADQLQANGDPRGEIIACELQSTEEAVAMHRVLLRSWLDDLPEAPDASVRLRYAFVEHLRLDARNRRWLTGHVGAYVRAVSIASNGAEVRKLLAELVSRPRPWLSKLSISSQAWGLRDDVVLDDQTVAALPNLLELELSGAIDLRGFVHPRLERLAWSVGDAGANMMRQPIAMPAVTTLVLDLTGWPRGLPTPKLDAFPALDTLDVSKTKSFELAEWLRTLAVRSQLKKLRLPFVTFHDAGVFGAALKGLSCELEFALAVPWPAPHELPRYGRMAVEDIEIPIASLVAVLERSDAHGQDRDAWATFFAVLSDAQRRPVYMPANIVERVAKTLPDNDPLSSDMVFKTAVLRARYAGDVRIWKR